MRIAVLGTGMVGQAHAGKLEELGHEVVVGTNDVVKTMAKTGKDDMGRPVFALWLKDHDNIRLCSFAEAAQHSELVINALSGQVSVEVLRSIKNDLAGKTLIDISNALDFSHGMPPRLFVVNTNSLGEQIQKALPKTRVVKAFNTMNAAVQANPKALASGDHHLFVAGNDNGARAEVIRIARDWYGWKNVLDLGDIKSARGMEMVFLLWFSIFGTLSSANFNYKITQ